MKATASMWHLGVQRRRSSKKVTLKASIHRPIDAPASTSVNLVYFLGLEMIMTMWAVAILVAAKIQVISLQSSVLALNFGWSRFQKTERNMRSEPHLPLQSPSTDESWASTSC